MAPADSPFWKIIETYNELEQRSISQKGDPATFFVDTYWPIYILDDDREPQLPKFPNINHVFQQPVRVSK